ncbi:hypothetical protein L2E82_35534 [Cichorium intybus]|uniref:Uncharacterized protein n=1 Tax=Cichorium intybus TaxID=13427 RepID=A0ACB9BP27_CICIN|nr:hypothetical protein L2E82_35534 [Cichorium intybus]
MKPDEAYGLIFSWDNVVVFCSINSNSVKGFPKDPKDATSKYAMIAETMQKNCEGPPSGLQTNGHPPPQKYPGSPAEGFIEPKIDVYTELLDSSIEPNYPTKSPHTSVHERNPHPQEIIEFPSIIVSSVTGQLEACFQTYVRPTCNKLLSDFCKDLTGIQQIQMVQVILREKC